MQKTKTVTIDGVGDFTVATVTSGVMQDFTLSKEDGTPLPNQQWNRGLLAASLKAGGTATVEDAWAQVNSLPVFLEAAFNQVFAAALEVNGLKSKGEETVPSTETAPSTGGGSTGA